MRVLKFGAAWCPGCLIMRPVWAELEKENTWLAAAYYDYDESPTEAARWGVEEKLPVFIFLDSSGQEFLRLQGEISKKKLQQIIEENKDK